METKHLPCIFCYKNVECNNLNTESATSTRLRFISLVQRYLRIDFKQTSIWESRVDDEATLLQFCEDCSIITHSFCDLYENLKRLEMELDWRMENIVVAILTGDIDVSRKTNNYFHAQVNERSRNDVIEFRRAFVEKCASHLSKVFPRVALERVSVLTTSSALENNNTSVFVDEVKPDISQAVAYPLVHDSKLEPSTVEGDIMITENDNPLLLTCINEEEEEIGIDTGEIVNISIPNELATIPETISNADEELYGDNYEEMVHQDSPEDIGITSVDKKSSSSQIPVIIPKNIEMDKTLIENNSEERRPSQRTLRKIYRCETCKLTVSTKNRLDTHMRSCIQQGEGSLGGHGPDTESEDESENGIKDEKKMSESDSSSLSLTSSSDFEMSSDDDNEDFNDNTSMEATKIKPTGESDKASLNSSLSNKEIQSEIKDDAKAKIQTPGKSTRQLGTKHKCLQCSQSFSKKYGLNQHLKKYHGEDEPVGNFKLTPDGLTIDDLVLKHNGKFICKVTTCREKFNTNEDLIRHSKSHGEFKCSLCPVTKSFAPELALHELSHSESGSSPAGKFKARYACLRCFYSTAQKQKYIEHHLETHLEIPVNKIKCPICAQLFHLQRAWQKISIYEHYKSHHIGAEDNRLNCDQCSAYFMTLLQLMKHKQGIHGVGPTGKGVYKCSDCSSAFKRFLDLRNHRIKKHTNSIDEFKFVCNVVPECSNRFETKAELDNHVIIIHSSKSCLETCSVCSKTFLGKSKLSRHIKMCHDEQYAEKRKSNTSKRGIACVCEICGKACINKQVMEIHMLSHSGPDSWKFVCSTCGRKCLSKQKLGEHQRTHTKEKPFVCEHCGEKYAHRHSWRNHVKTKHGDKAT